MELPWNSGMRQGNKMSRPPVTALLPVRNGEQWMPNAIHNLNRTLTPYDEVVIVNDYSTDKTLDIIEESKFIAPLRVITNPGRGLVPALNAGISAAKNEWIARFDVDDDYLSNRFALQFENVSDGTVAIFSDFEIYSEKMDYLGYFPSPLYHAAIYVSLLNSERNAHPSVVFRKESVLTVGGYYEEDFPCEDLSLWLRLAKIGRLSAVPQPVLKYTLRKNSVSSSRYLEAKHKTKLVLEKYFDYNKNMDLKEFELILIDYKKYPQELERKLFLARDLCDKTLMKNQELKLRFFIIKIAINLSLNPRTYLVLAKQVLMRKKRRKYRKT